MIVLLSCLLLGACLSTDAGQAAAVAPVPAVGPRARPALPARAPAPVAAESEPAPAPALAPAPPGDEREVDLPQLRLALVDAASRALASGETGRAIELTQLVLLGDAEHPAALFLLGVAYMGQGQPDLAREQLLRADAVRPDDAATLSLLARLAYELEGPGPAGDLLERVVLLDPGQASHWVNLGIVRLDQRAVGPALDALQRAITLDPDCAAAHRGLGRLYSLVEEPDLAERAWRTSLELDPGDPVAWLALGHALRDQHQLEAALQAYRSGAELLPGDPWMAANVGSVLMALGRPHEARGPLMEAVAGLEHEPLEQAHELVELGHCLASSGDLAGAEDCFREAGQVDPALAPAHAALGALLLDRGRPGQARAALQRAFALGGLPADLVVELAALHERSGDLEAARACAEQLRSPSEDPAVLLQRARLMLASEDPELHDAASAEALLERLLRGPLAGHGAGWALLSRALAERGALAEAVDALDEALQCGDDVPGRMSWSARRAWLQGLMDKR